MQERSVSMKDFALIKFISYIIKPENCYKADKLQNSEQNTRGANEAPV